MTAALESRIKQEALRLGFELAGITTADPPPHFPVYEHWLAMGRQASMGYLNEERARIRRADPKQILPGCQSIIVVGLRYSNPELGNDNESGRITGRVAAYAWGADYHLVLPEKLKALTAFIDARAGQPIPHRWYTDTGPLLERDLAMRAGLGWIGKNTCLINPQHGSYFLLAEILLAHPLQPDAPFEADRCGTCTRCLEACPTKCILPDRTLDAGRCISFLTIEERFWLHQIETETASDGSQATAVYRVYGKHDRPACNGAGDLRVSLRVEIMTPVTLAYGTCANGLTSNIGVGGMAVCRLAQPLRVGSTTLLRFEVPGHAQTIKAAGTVVWTKQDRAGIAFGALTPSDRAMLDSFVIQEASKRSPALL